ncbi:hypothetical protein CFP56_028377 [Quercus suber]|uniref:Uncharacterized protein n=1 Tax=Quercus suber TaxID=58331 RepID=A0AAW0JTE6_QUESU
MEVAQIAPLLSQTLSPDSNAVRTASEALDRLSLRPEFPFSLLAIAADSLVNFLRFQTTLSTVHTSE